MKKLINDPRNVVREMLEGIVDSNPDLALLGDERVVVLSDAPVDNGGKVAVISGGGSGHEPAHVGYVGAGMLSGAVVGDVFTSPSVDAVLAGIRHFGKSGGVLLIVKNYTGDRLNFGLAAELARAEGIAVETVVVADDVSLRKTGGRDAGRGIAGTVLVHKLAGAAAARGANLASVAALARSAAARIRSMGVGLGACTVPAAGKASYSLGDDEIELGLGIHGEKGALRTKAMPADALVDTVVERILVDASVSAATPVVVLVNGLGGTPAMELAIVMRRVLGCLRERDFSIARAWMGNFMTALEMPGFSLSILPVSDDDLALLDAPTSAPAWPGEGIIHAARGIVRIDTVATRVAEVAANADPQSTLMKGIVGSIADKLLAAENALADLDAISGDGDLGASMARAAIALRSLSDGDFSSAHALLRAMSAAMRRAVGGSSGPFYAVGLLRASIVLQHAESPTEKDWQTALAEAIEAISELGGAGPGERTMLDALIPALAAWRSDGDRGFEAAAVAAAEGAAATAHMEPRHGRASYVGKRALGNPDGGAVAVATWLGAVADALPA